MATLTIRNLPEELMDRLRKVKEESGESINRIVVRALVNSFAVHPGRRDLSRYTTWTDEDHAEFMSALDAQRRIDDALWE